MFSIEHRLHGMLLVKDVIDAANVTVVVLGVNRHLGVIMPCGALSQTIGALNQTVKPVMRRFFRPG